MADTDTEKYYFRFISALNLDKRLSNERQIARLIGAQPVLESYDVF